MATRFYCPSTGVPSISPAFNGTSWPVSTNAIRRSMVTTRISSAMTELAGLGDAATGNQLLVQYISSVALGAQTLTGSIKGQVRGRSTGGSPGVIAVRVAKCNSDGSVVTEIMAVQKSTDLGTVPPNFTESVALTNRRLEQGVDDFVLGLTSTAIDAGDFLIVELGYEDITTNASRAVVVSLGDDSATDLAEDETTTAANNPWVEFTADISFAGGDVLSSQACY